LCRSMRSKRSLKADENKTQSRIDLEVNGNGTIVPVF
jgi:hypothetical protein